MDSEPITYGLRGKTRAIAAVSDPTSSSVNSQFLAGTCSVRSGNEVHLIEFDDSSDEVVCQRVYSHRQQVLDLVASPTSTQQFLSAHVGDDGASGCTLWNMQDLHSAVVMTLTSPLEALATFPEALAADFKRSHQDFIYCAGISGVSAHAIAAGAAREAAKVAMKSVRTCAHVAADALHGDVVYVRQSCLSYHRLRCSSPTCKQVAANAGIQAIDFRAGSVAWACDPKIHSPQTRRVACNINKPFNFSSVGDDGMLRLWDRRTSHPLHTHVAHDSWCFGLAINPFHDQLTVHIPPSSPTVTCGVDGRVKLWMLTSASSVAAGSAGASTSPSTILSEDSGSKLDGMVSMNSNFTDSLYNVVWSSVDAFIYGSVCYNGSVTLQRVSQDVKYSILL